MLAFLMGIVTFQSFLVFCVVVRTLNRVDELHEKLKKQSPAQ